MVNDDKAKHENPNFIGNKDLEKKKYFQIEHFWHSKGCENKATFGIFHRGEQLHEASEITQGERYNLIIWLRSSPIRNKMCPMCRKKPNELVEAVRYGEGFTK